jgi:endoglucanase
VRDDALLAWRGSAARRDRPQQRGRRRHPGAWALLRAADKWRQPEYAAAGKRIAQDIRAKLLRQVAHGLVLVPGMEGFDKPDGMTINLSYWVFPALPELARADPAPEWEELAKTGTTILATRTSAAGACRPIG